MITAKSIIELIEKEKLIVYFILLWAGSFLFYNINSMIYYVGNFNAYYGVAVFSTVLELLAGVMLGLLGVTLMVTGFKLPLTKERLLVFFLLLWAGSFFFWGINAFINNGPVTAQNAFYLIGGLFDLVAGAVLTFFSLKLLGVNIARSNPPPPPP